MAAYSGEPAKVGKNLIDTLGAEGKEIVQLLANDSHVNLEQGDTDPCGLPGQARSPTPKPGAW